MLSPDALAKDYSVQILDALGADKDLIICLRNDSTEESRKPLFAFANRYNRSVLRPLDETFALLPTRLLGLSVSTYQAMAVLKKQQSPPTMHFHGRCCDHKGKGATDRALPYKIIGHDPVEQPRLIAARADNVVNPSTRPRRSNRIQWEWFLKANGTASSIRALPVGSITDVASNLRVVEQNLQPARWSSLELSLPQLSIKVTMIRQYCDQWRLNGYQCGPYYAGTVTRTLGQKANSQSYFFAQEEALPTSHNPLS